MFRPDFRVFVLPWKQTVSPTFTLLQKRSDVHSKVTFFFAGGKKKKHVTVLPGFCPPLFTSHQKSAGIIVLMSVLMPAISQISTPQPTNVDESLANPPGWKSPKERKPPKTPQAKHPLLPLSSEFSGEIFLSKLLSPKLPCRNAIHLHRTATNTRFPTKPFETANLFREFWSFLGCQPTKIQNQPWKTIIKNK